jgi:methylated-DNA-[protein]-cysteine S-methyltransferase
LAPQNFGLARSKIDQTPIGTIEVLATANGVYQVNLLGHTPRQPNLNSAKLNESDFSKLALQQIVEYLTGQRRSFDLSLDWSTSKPFQKKVLVRALAIPFGQVTTYGELAREMGSIAASRAVGGAMARNPIPIIIPCHRVVASDGRLTGYSAAEGVRTKQWLLELEGHKIVSEKLV